MATTDEPHSKQGPAKFRWPRRDGPFRFTVEQFYQLDELDYFGDRHVELIEGIIYEMKIDPPQATASLLASEALRAIFGLGWVVSESRPLETGRRSLLEPDLSVVQGSIRDFAQAHPTTAALIVEIGDSTLRKDRTLKAHQYASAGILDYWIVNLVDRQLEVHRDPGPDRDRKGRFRYADVTNVPGSGTMAPLAAPGSTVAVADLLP